ncbi:AAA family ATPase [Ancylomarina sp. YFZ004]
MDIIERIEIKHFRSFDGGKGHAKVIIENLQDLNVFSGANDSGKSNVLRALNLFFNDEISPGVKFEKSRDFSKIVANRFDLDLVKRKEDELERVADLKNQGIIEKAKDFRRSDEIVSIKLFFNNKKKQRGLPTSFWVSKSYSQKNNFEGEYIYQTDLKGNAQVTLFINSFRFEYVPAIKDRQYFNHLFEKLQTYLFEKEDKKKQNKFSVSSSNFNNILKTETSELFEKFQLSSGVDANFYIPSTLVDFFRTLSVRTENDISLFDRGDGVQARFIPEILDEISKSSKKNIIWGFEEPENSYETKNIIKIRDEFLLKYSKEKQIFITSHTKEFLSLKKEYTQKELSILNDSKLNTNSKKEIAFSRLKDLDSSSNISLYRVWKNNETENTSQVTRFNDRNNEWENTCDDLGVILEARIIENLQNKLHAQAHEIANSSLSTTNQKLVIEEINAKMSSYLEELKDAKYLIEEYEKPILIVEDKYDSIYKIAYLKSKNILCTKDNFNDVFKKECYFTIRRAESAGSVAGKLRMNNTDGYENKKIIGLFDFDKEGSENFYHLKKGNNWKNSEILGDLTSGFYKKREKHECFYSLLLPVPERHTNLVSDIKKGKFESLVEVENLLCDEILIDNKLVTKEQVYNIDYYKIKENVKSSIDRVLIDLTKEDFKDFIPLYKQIHKLFNN